VTDEGEPGFDPQELESIAQAMDGIMEDEASGYEMLFWISHGAANELLEAFDRYQLGSVQDGIRCMYEFSKIVEQLRYHVEEEDE
jgi:hypothetical protein